jgi:HemX protein
MMVLTDRQWFMCALVPYGLSAVYSISLWRHGFRHHNRATYLLLLLGFVFNTVALLKRGFTGHSCPTHNLYEATTFVLWAMLAGYLVLGIWGKIRFLGAFSSPVVFVIGLFALMPGLDRIFVPRRGVSVEWMSLHAALVLWSYAAFALAAVAAVMYLTQTHNLRFNRLQAILSLLPPIEGLELAMGGFLLAGFILLSAGLAASARIQENPTVSYFADLKVSWSILVWVVYLALLMQRWWFQQRGRRLALGLVGAFVFVALTFWITAWLSPRHNPALEEKSEIPSAGWVAGIPWNHEIHETHERNTEGNHQGGYPARSQSSTGSAFGRDQDPAECNSAIQQSGTLRYEAGLSSGFGFRDSDFGFVSDFGFRVSDFPC